MLLLLITLCLHNSSMASTTIAKIAGTPVTIVNLNVCRRAVESTYIDEIKAQIWSDLLGSCNPSIAC